MKYRGHVKNGTIVLEGAPPLEEGASVMVEPVEPADRAPRGSARAIGEVAGTWHGEPQEIQRLLLELQEMKWAEVRKQEGKDDDSLSS